MRNDVFNNNIIQKLIKAQRYFSIAKLYERRKWCWQIECPYVRVCCD
jgi:hypothetical protein